MATTLQPGRLYRLVVSGTGTSKYHPVFGKPDYEIAPAPDFDPFYCFAATCGDSPIPHPHGMLFVNGSRIRGPMRKGDPTYLPPYSESHVYEFFVYLDTQPSKACSLGAGGDGEYTRPFDALYIDGAGEVVLPDSKGVALRSSWFLPCALVAGADGQDTLARGRLEISVGGSLGQRGPDPFVSIHSGSFEIAISDAGPAPAAPGTAPATPPAAKPKAGSQPAAQKGVVGKRYAVRGTGQGRVLPSKTRIEHLKATYKPHSARVRLGGALTYTNNGRGRLVAGTAVIDLVLKKERGAGPPTRVARFKYRLVSARDATVDNSADRFRFIGTLVPPDLPPCNRASVTTGWSGLVDVSFCGIRAVFTGTVSIA